MKSTCTALIAVLANGAAASMDPLRQQFESFIVKFEREYKTLEEKEKRFQIFKKNVEYYDSENSKGNNFTLGINHFADMTQMEFEQEFCSGVVVPKDGIPNPSAVHTMSGLQVAERWDWEQRGAVTPVKNQGSCGSCWSFSSTGALEGAYKIKTGQLISLSEEELVNCEQRNGCHGGFPSRAFNWVRDHGLCLESDYPYDHRENQYCRMRSCAAALQPGVVTGYAQVPRSESAMMDAVVQQPVSVLLYAGRWNGYHRGIFSASQCQPWTGYHAVLLVGYAPDYWRIKNSWGSGWFGEAGYIRLQRGVRGTGACDVLNVATYPQLKGAPSPTPSPSPFPSPSPTPSPHPGKGCKYNSECPAGEKCYYPSADASSGICSANPPSPHPAPAPSPTPSQGCKYDSGCPAGKKCYYLSQDASSGICLVNPPQSALEPSITV